MACWWPSQRHRSTCTSCCPSHLVPLLPYPHSLVCCLASGPVRWWRGEEGGGMCHLTQCNTSRLILYHTYTYTHIHTNTHTQTHTYPVYYSSRMNILKRKIYTHHHRIKNLLGNKLHLQASQDLVDKKQDMFISEGLLFDDVVEV